MERFLIKLKKLLWKPSVSYVRQMEKVLCEELTFFNGTRCSEGGL